MMMKPDSDESNNNTASVNNISYLDNNQLRSRNINLGEEQVIQEGDDEDEDEELDGSGEEVFDYSEYEDGIEEFSASGSVSVNKNTTTVTTNSSSAANGMAEQLVLPDQIRNVVQELPSATETIQDETYDWPRTEALIGIRPYAQDAKEDEEDGGSGGGRNNDDDDEDDDYDDEETEIMKARKRVKNARENAERGGSRRFNNYNGNLEEDSGEDGSSRYLKNRRFGKNNAIKFISTPHGKVGILYSSADDAKKTNTVSAGGSSASSSGAGVDSRRDMFRGISSDLRPILTSNSDGRSADDRGGESTGGKMTPVLTADGKVALLYRGASADNENGAKKYEPIVNYTKPAVPEPKREEKEEHHVRTPNVDDRDDDEEDDDQEGSRKVVMPRVEEPTTQREGNDLFSRFGNSFPSREMPFMHRPHTEGHKPLDGDNRGQDFPAPAHPPQPPPPKLEDNNFLPILDRPLSELLGLKKHQFTHFRVTEPAPTTPIPQVNMRGKLPANYDYEDQGGNDYNEVSDQEILTKTEVVNLAIVPSLTQEQNSVVHQKGSVHFKKQRPFRFEDLSNIHCATQFVVGLVALCCIFGMVGAYFRNRFLDTQVPTYRL